MNLIFISGPHAAGKTTLIHNLKAADPSLLTPELSSRAPQFHTDPLERIILKIAQRAIENYEYAQIAKTNPEKIILGNRCIYDSEAYARAYLELGWISFEQYELINKLGKNFFPQEVREPEAIVYNPAFEAVKERLQERWKTTERKWKEDDLDYCRAACESFKELKGKRNILYLDSLNPTAEAEAWLKEKVKYALMRKAC